MLFGIRLLPFAIVSRTDIKKAILIFDQGYNIEVEVRHINADGVRLHPDILVAITLAYRIHKLKQNVIRGIAGRAVGFYDDVNIAAVRIFLRSNEGLLGV